MTFPKARLAVSVCLFAAWIGFLLYQVVVSRSITLAKPQFLTAQAIVVADVSGDARPDSKVKVAEVLWSARKTDEALTATTLLLPDLAGCGRSEGYQGEGKYLLPLIQVAGRWMIAPVARLHYYPAKPATHGTVEAFGVFSYRATNRLPLEEAQAIQKEWTAAGFDATLTAEELRIYPLTPDTRAQVKELIETRR